MTLSSSCAPDLLPPDPASAAAPAAAPLVNVVWRALTTAQAPLAQGGELARRYDPAYAYFGARRDASPETLLALARLVPTGQDVALFEPEDVDPGAYFDVLAHKNIVQMIGPARGEVADPGRFVSLGADDRVAIHDLVRRTEPGPFYERSTELGRFIGLRDGGRLVAIAGERMHLDGHVEISAVCTDPDWRGRGLARDLVLLTSRAIVARGETPFLHVLAENAGAIVLYERLGFTRSLQSRITVLRRNGMPAG